MLEVSVETNEIEAADRERLVLRRQVRERYSKSDETIRRWVRDGNFPRPLEIRRRHYWRLRDLLDWEQRAVIESEAA